MQNSTDERRMISLNSLTTATYSHVPICDKQQTREKQGPQFSSLQSTTYGQAIVPCCSFAGDKLEFPAKHRSANQQGLFRPKTGQQQPPVF
jgi:hypothetical protein